MFIDFVNKMCGRCGIVEGMIVCTLFPMCSRLKFIGLFCYKFIFAPQVTLFNNIKKILTKVYDMTLNFELQ